jgi:hypothetical protein
MEMFMFGVALFLIILIVAFILCMRIENRCTNLIQRLGRNDETKQ